MVKTTRKDLFFVIQRMTRTLNYLYKIMMKTFFLRILIVWKRSNIEKKNLFRNIKWFQDAKTVNHVIVRKQLIAI